MDAVGVLDDLGTLDDPFWSILQDSACLFLTGAGQRQGGQKGHFGGFAQIRHYCLNRCSKWAAGAKIGKLGIVHSMCLKKSSDLDFWLGALFSSDPASQNAIFYFFSNMAEYWILAI